MESSFIPHSKCIMQYFVSNKPMASMMQINRIPRYLWYTYLIWNTLVNVSLPVSAIIHVLWKVQYQVLDYNPISLLISELKNTLLINLTLVAFDFSDNCIDFCLAFLPSVCSILSTIADIRRWVMSPILNRFNLTQ